MAAGTETFFKFPDPKARVFGSADGWPDEGRPESGVFSVVLPSCHLVLLMPISLTLPSMPCHSPPSLLRVTPHCATSLALPSMPPIRRTCQLISPHCEPPPRAGQPSAGQPSAEPMTFGSFIRSDHYYASNFTRSDRRSSGLEEKRDISEFVSVQIFESNAQFAHRRRKASGVSAATKGFCIIRRISYSCCPSLVCVVL